jgi:hypothetical protein
MRQSSPPREVVPALMRCMGHGIVPAQGCPHGCSKSFLRPIHADEADASPGYLLLENIAAVEHPTEIAVTLHPDERMTEAEVRAALRDVLSHIPFGSKKPLARLCGYRGRWSLHTLKGVAKDRAMLPEACRIRLSRTLNQFLRGEWILVKTGMRTADSCPSHEWLHHQSVEAQHDRVPIKL